MVALTLTLSTLSLLVYGAHELRQGNWFSALCSISLIGQLFFRRRPWVPRLFQFLFAVGAVMWSSITWELAHARAAQGGDPRRLVVILGSVIAVNLLSAILLGTPRVLARYRVPPPDGAPAPHAG